MATPKSKSPTKNRTTSRPGNRGSRRTVREWKSWAFSTSPSSSSRSSPLARTPWMENPVGVSLLCRPVDPLAGLLGTLLCLFSLVRWWVSFHSSDLEQYWWYRLIIVKCSTYKQNGFFFLNTKVLVRLVGGFSPHIIDQGSIRKVRQQESTPRLA